MDPARIPKRQYLTRNRTNVLTCGANGYPRAEVRWSKTGEQLKGPRYRQDFTGSLIIDGGLDKDLGSYTCTVLQMIPLTANSQPKTFRESFVIEVSMAGTN